MIGGCPAFKKTGEWPETGTVKKKEYLTLKRNVFVFGQGGSHCMATTAAARSRQYSPARRSTAGFFLITSLGTYSTAKEARIFLKRVRPFSSRQRGEGPRRSSRSLGARGPSSPPSRLCEKFGPALRHRKGFGFYQCYGRWPWQLWFAEKRLHSAWNGRVGGFIDRHVLKRRA